MEDKQSLGRRFLELSAISAYGIWVMVFLFPLTLAGILFLIDARRSPQPLILSSIELVSLQPVTFSAFTWFGTQRHYVLKLSRRRIANRLLKSLSEVSGGGWLHWSVQSQQSFLVTCALQTCLNFYPKDFGNRCSMTMRYATQKHINLPLSFTYSYSAAW